MPPTDTLIHAALVFYHLHHTGKASHIKIQTEAEHQVNSSLFSDKKWNILQDSQHA